MWPCPAMWRGKKAAAPGRGAVLQLERPLAAVSRGPRRGFPSVLPHVQMPAPAERMPARCQRSLEFHCFKIFINVKMSLALKPRQYSRGLFAGVEVSDAEKPLSCKYKLY